MVDPVGDQTGFQLITARFADQLILDHNSRSATVRGYLDALNELFRARGFPLPVNFNDPDNLSNVIFKAWKEEETVAKQRAPLTPEIFAQMQKMADESGDQDSVESVVFDWFSLIRIIGCRGAEYAQKTQTKVEVHEYPSGNTVVKAFIRVDWTFYDEKGRILKTLDRETLGTARKVKIRFRIQKNRQNGQEISVVADVKNAMICPVQAACRICLRAARLGQAEDEPLAVFKNKSGNTRYLTTSKIEEVLRGAARIAHPDWSKERVNRLSTHSGRVWALVLLSEAGMDPDFMKSRLRWLGESYRLYLRDTAEINKMHDEALQKASQRVMTLLGANKDALPSMATEDSNMGDYVDI